MKYEYFYLYDPTIKRRVPHLLLNGWYISLVTGNKIPVKSAKNMKVIKTAKRICVNPNGTFLEKNKDVKIKYIRGRKFISINGELYIQSGGNNTRDNHIKEINFKPLGSIKNYKKDIDYLVDELSKRVSIKDVLRQKLYDMDVESINKLIRELDKGAKPKRRYGCLSLKVGKESIDLLD